MAAYLFNGNSSPGGFPTNSYGPPTQQQVIDFAAAYFTPEVLDAFWKTMGVPSTSRSMVAAPAPDELPIPAEPRPSRVKLVD